MFAGVLCYADDLVLLAPCAFALRCMLSICQSYADDHGLLFNATKTQLINPRRACAARVTVVVRLSVCLSVCQSVTTFSFSALT